MSGIEQHITFETIEKYNIPGPRYTSYPTAPHWETSVNHLDYERALENISVDSSPISLYIHIPFCQQLCTFCACMVKIRSKNSSVASDYLQLLFRELDLLSKSLGEKKSVVQLHIGGGTPNFLTSSEMTSLWRRLEKTFTIDPQGEISIEIDPRTLELEQLSVYRQLGFNRLSMGIQDFDPRVQKAINRIQSFEKVSRIFEKSRQLNFSSINADLVYGLPCQTEKNFEKTAVSVSQLEPHRIALYSFAYVPWMKKHQKLIDRDTLPSPQEKIRIFLKSRAIFLKNRYKSIGMDHFALEEDSLYDAFSKKKLYRNFMGYTLRYTQNFLGLGLSSIGFVDHSFFQNHKNLNLYKKNLDIGQLATERGKILTRDDKIRLWTIYELMCHFWIEKDSFEKKFKIPFDTHFAKEKQHLDNCEKEELLSQNKKTICVTEKGKLFVRNICIGFDSYFSPAPNPIFSQTV